MRNVGLNRKSHGGFSMIEVLITIVIVSVGLLAVGMMQVSALSKTRAAAQRAHAVDLAYDMIDGMRSNPLEAYRIAQLGSGTVSGTSCSGTLTPASASPAQFTNYWKCSVSRRLPNATATVTYTAGVAAVRLTWRDDKREDNPTARTTTIQISGGL